MSEETNQPVQRIPDHVIELVTDASSVVEAITVLTSTSPDEWTAAGRVEVMTAQSHVVGRAWRGDGWVAFYGVAEGEAGVRGGMVFIASSPKALAVLLIQSSSERFGNDADAMDLGLELLLGFGAMPASGAEEMARENLEIYQDRASKSILDARSQIQVLLRVLFGNFDMECPEAPEGYVIHQALSLKKVKVKKS